MSTAPGTNRGTYARTAERRSAIARAVLDLVLEKGHGGVTTAETAARAEISEATVLYHFPTRDHLLVAALRLAFDEDDERLSSGQPDVDLDGLRRYVIGGNREVALLYTMLAGYTGTPGHPAREFFAEHYAQALERWTAIIAARQQAGLAHPGIDAAEAARQFLAAWTGLRTQWLIDPGFDLGESVVTAFRRSTGENVMDLRRVLLDPAIGL
ncbi:TetR/AcrR family transcriptional regulator [Nocardia sp. CA2R105]|uniref:TetR/AcrR family transcriptional regulator n=1 Tax=Nocardia coffeae TaxID=2873381 RepID=UPI001CA624AD|nr:TetR/AcrR family transcriptional regulator [Nocardia coffeae]MBY8861800.1 TetR/AcrR family transcriptional regulator [Nocardia coffeae]